MEGIIRPLGGGKTYELITKHFLTTTNILVVMIEKEKQQIIDEFYLSKEQANRIITAREAKNKFARKTEAVIIDNVEYLLGMFLGKVPKVVTFTGGSKAKDFVEEDEG